MNTKLQKSSVNLFLLFAFLFVGCGEISLGEEGPTWEPETSIEETVPPPTPAAEESVEVVNEVSEAGDTVPVSETPIEVIEGGATSEIQGELNLAYPLLIKAGTNEIVKITIHKLDVAGVPSPTFGEVSSDPIVDLESTNFGITKTHTVNVYITEQVRVELDSLTFQFAQISPGPPTKAINLNDSSQSTTWAWEMLAPAQEGAQRFTVKVFLEEEEFHSWARTFAVTVLDELPVEGTPVVNPRGSSNESGILSGSGSLLLIGLIVLGVIGVVGFAYLKSQTKEPSPAEDKGLFYGNDRSTADILNSKYKVELSETLEEALNLSELSDLCFDLDVNYENFEGGLVEKVQKVVSHFIRHSRLQELTDYIAEKRPDIDLPKHQLELILEDNFGRSELRDLCVFLDLEVEDVDVNSVEMIRKIMALMTKSNPAENVVDYLAKKYPEIDLLETD